MSISLVDRYDLDLENRDKNSIRSLFSMVENLKLVSVRHICIYIAQNWLESTFLSTAKIL